MTEKCILLGMLAYFAREDLRFRRIPLAALCLFGALGMLLAFAGRERRPQDVLGGVCVGLFLLIISLVGRGSVGLGDGFLFCVTGIYLGFQKNAALLVIALFLAAGLAGILLAVKRCGRKGEFAFVPCVLAAYLLMLI